MIEDLIHPIVRDLCWVMESPSLIAESSSVVDDAACESSIASNKDWLLSLDRRPEPLIRWVEQRHSSRLGFYFEQLVAFWLQRIIAPDHAASHVRVMRDKRVLGEYDFLFYSSERQVIEHWETAVKFFLRFEDHDNNHYWYGPNPDDTLDNKLSHMTNHQLRLSEFPEAAQVLTNVARDVFHTNNAVPVVSRAFFKGYLFYPSNGDWTGSAVTHPAAAPHHLRGWWTRVNESCIPASDADVYYTVLPRLRWLAPAVIGSGAPSKDTGLQLFDASQLHTLLASHFDRSQQPVLVAELTPDAEGLWREQSRGFVVGAAWPQKS